MTRYHRTGSVHYTIFLCSLAHRAAGKLAAFRHIGKVVYIGSTMHKYLPRYTFLHREAFQHSGAKFMFSHVGNSTDLCRNISPTSARVDRRSQPSGHLSLCISAFFRAGASLQKCLLDDATHRRRCWSWIVQLKGSSRRLPHQPANLAGNPNALRKRLAAPHMRCIFTPRLRYYMPGSCFCLRSSVPMFRLLAAISRNQDLESWRFSPPPHPFFPNFLSSLYFPLFPPTFCRYAIPQPTGTPKEWVRRC